MSVILLDNYGCGDSFGNFSYNDIEILEKNMTNVLNHIKSVYKGQIILISRGLSCNLIIKLHSIVDYIYCIDPIGKYDEILKKDDFKNLLLFEKYQLGFNKLITNLKIESTNCLFRNVDSSVFILIDDSNKEPILKKNKVSYQKIDCKLYVDPNAIYYIFDAIALNERNRN